jgi:hypothetical protein
MSRVVVLLLLLTLSSVSDLTAQIVLKPSITGRVLPSDNDSLCPVGIYSTNFETNGLHVGDTAYDFDLFDINGNAVSLSQILSLGKPVLLVGGSYTCTIFRGNIPVVNAIDSQFHSEITTLVIYTPEAHPIIDPCPYGPYFNDVIEQNQEDHIQYRQPRTYGERKQIVRDMLTRIKFSTPVLLDGTCNQWFLTYGPAPNNAYLIDTHGIIRAKEPWFDLNGDNIYEDIASIVSNDTTTTPVDSGIVSFEFLTNDTVFTSPGSTVSLGGRLINNSASAAQVSVYRHNSSKLPNDWKTAMCTNVCLGPDQDSAFIEIPPNSSKQIIVYFYVGSTPGIGRVYLHFANESLADDTSRVRLVVIAAEQSGVSRSESSQQIVFRCFPNPTTDLLHIETNVQYDRIQIVDVLGCTIENLPQSLQYDLKSIPSGTYQIEFISKAGDILGATKMIRN